MAESFASSSTWTGHVRPPTARRPGVAVRTLGCKVNQVESEAILAELLGMGFRAVDAEDAVAVVINTCTVTGEADHKARKIVRHTLALPGSPAVIVTGCAASTEPDALRALGERVVVEPDKALVAARVADALGLGSWGAETIAPVTRVGCGFHARALVKVEDGCDAFCAYCIVPHARGGPRSVPLSEVVSQVEELVGGGVAEVVVTGINVGRYESGTDGLAALLREIAGTGVRRIRLSSIEPDHLTDELLATMSATPAFCEHLHVPLQSASDAVLQRMARRYTAAAYAERIAAARSALPGACISTDVIAGFPGETNEDSQETLRFCEEIGFGKLHVFRYSRREGTLAAGMEGQIDPREIARRAAALRVCGDRLRTSWIDAEVGSSAELLVERAFVVGGTPYVAGTTRGYTKVEARSVGDLDAGEVARVRLDGRRGQTAFGEVVGKA